jgi:hypothetical protein
VVAAVDGRGLVLHVRYVTDPDGVVTGAEG